jgi:hypothetical protein
MMESKSKAADNNSLIITQDVTETKKHFGMRKHVYEKAIGDGVAQERAVVLSQVFKNCYYMGCSYPESVMNESKKYWPSEALSKPLFNQVD